MVNECKSLYEEAILYGVDSNVHFTALLDTGADVNFIGDTLEDGSSVMEIGWLDALPEGGRYIVPGGNTITGDVVIFPKLQIDQKVSRNVQFTVIEGEIEAAIGICTMQELGIKIDTGISKAYV